MKSTLLLTTLLALSLNTVAQKNNVIVKPSSNTIIAGPRAPKNNANRQVVRPTQSATTAKGQTPNFEKNGSSFVASLQNAKVDKAIGFVSRNFGLSNAHNFVLTRTVTDDLGITHYSYAQHYKGVLSNEGMVLLHGKNGSITSANGQVAAFENLNVTPSITKERAKQLALDFVKAKEYLKTDYPIELLVVNDRAKNKYVLAYKVRVDASVPLDMSEIFVDAQTGKVINKIPLIAHADVQGTAQTLYSGAQTITADSYNGSYRLRENGRKIETYNSANASGISSYLPLTEQTIAGYSNALAALSLDVTDNDNTWNGSPLLTYLVISSANTSWWYAPIIDSYADLYIKIRNGSNQVVFTSTYVNNTNPAITIPVNLQLTNPPYTFEIWDYDAGSSDDYGGSYSINSSNGAHSFSGSGNSGGYLVSNTAAMLDVHWGMEKTYDFFLSVFGRNSYDGSSSVIKNFVFPPGLYNNANALPHPYNIMQYGVGDWVQMSDVVGLDVEGHEFTHMVVNHSIFDGNSNPVGLKYERESGALNESFADIFGTCIEFYSNTSPDWFIGESIMVSSPFMRSMSNPNAASQPDTYGSPLTNGFWRNPDCGVPNQQQNDYCGVHINSGVQNFWFYLLCQGGTGTNDIGNAYSVNGIGISQARVIAYRNLTTQLTQYSTFWDSYIGSLQAAADLYGIGSTQWNAVNNAWYAVGIGNGTNNNTTYCTGTTYLYEPSGTFTDGSGSLNYLDYGDCIWSIQPAGANTVTLTFPQFNTESDYDSVMVYDGPDENYPLLMTWWGTTLPPSITSTDGALTVRFMSDESIQASGWTANYTSSGTAYCDGGNLLTTPTGSFNDASGTGNYGNNQFCYWHIAPPCANSVTLSFSQFNTENGYDGVMVYDGGDLNAPLILNTSGTTIPGAVTSSGGEMLVVFLSDFSGRFPGFAASYTSSGSAYCSGTTSLTNDWGNLTDGSGTNDYCNNMSCNWLIQPTGATSVTLNFVDFDLEPASVDGQSIYDAVEVYNGPNASSPLLGRFTGNNLPPSLTSSGGSMYVKFYSDEAVTASGWSGYYTSTTANYCTGMTTLTAPSGTFADGSGVNQYGNNADCQWLIEPVGASSVTLGFTAFDTETNYDGVIVYDGNSTSAAVLNQFTGATLPNTITSTGGSMLVQFLSDVAGRQSGWNAYYNSSIAVGLDNLQENQFSIFPNPTTGSFVIQTKYDKADNPVITIFDAQGKTVKEIDGSKLIDGRIDVELKSAKGLYFVEMKTASSSSIRKLMIE